MIVSALFLRRKREESHVVEDENADAVPAVAH
jgi:hypothetical protein